MISGSGVGMAIDLHPQEPFNNKDDAVVVKPNMSNYKVQGLSYASVLMGTDSSSSSSSSSPSSGALSSGFSTPPGSEFGSTEAESSEEDEFMAELTRQMADYMLQEDDSNTASDHLCENNNKPICDSSSWADFNLDSESYNDQRHKGTSLKYTSVPSNVKNPDTWFYTSQGFAQDQQYKPAEQQTHHYNKQNYLMQQNRGFGHGGRVRPSGSRLAGPGMRAIFLGGPKSRNGSSGTGVFLPHGAANATESSRKKPGCSTVLIPTRVLEALEQHFNQCSNQIEASSHSIGSGGFKGPPRLSPGTLTVPSPYVKPRRNDRQPQTQENRKKQSESNSAPSNTDVQLPQDWTY